MLGSAKTLDRAPLFLVRQYRRVLHDLSQGRDVLWLFPRDVRAAEHVHNLYRLASESMLMALVPQGEWRWKRLSEPLSSSGTQLRLALHLPSPDSYGDGAEALVIGPETIPSPWNSYADTTRPPSSGRQLALEIIPPVRERVPVVIPALANHWCNPVSRTVHLSVREFWGWNSTVDMKYTAQMLISEGEDPANAMWTESVWVELASFDSTP